MKNKLYRDEQHKKIGGVCAGLAEYFDVDISLVRVVFVLTALLGGSSVLIYFVLWIVIPSKTFINADDQFFNSPQPKPFVAVKPTMSTGGAIAGVVLIMLGGFLLLDQFHMIPDLDFDKFWPVILIVVGLFLMGGFWKQKHVEKSDGTWKSTDQSGDVLTDSNSQTI